MRFRRVRAAAFGPLQDKELVFAPGVNIIYGPNEAGKSSWVGAIYGALCGLRRGRGLRRETNDFTDRYQPWDGEQWAVELELSLSDGRIYQIRRNLANPAATQVLDGVTGDDLSEPLLHEGSPDGALLLGLTRETIPSTVFVRQADMLRALERAEDLQAQIQSAAATGTTDQTAEAALSQLKDFHGTRVGTMRARTKPLARAAKRVEEARAVLDEATAAHDEYLSLIAARNEARAQASAAEATWRSAALREAKQRQSELTDRVDRAKSLLAGFEGGKPPVLGIDQEIIGRIDDALSRFRNRPAPPAALTGASSDELKAEIARLPDRPNGDLEPTGTFVEAERRMMRLTEELTQARQAEPAAPPTRPDVSEDVEPAAIRSLAERIGAVAPAVDKGLRERIDQLVKRRTRAIRVVRSAQVFGVILVGLGAVGVATTFLGAAWPGWVLLAAGLTLLGWSLLYRGRPVDEAMLSEHRATLAVQEDAARRVEQAREAALGEAFAQRFPVEPESLLSLASRIESYRAAKALHAQWQVRWDDISSRHRESCEQVIAIAGPRLRAQPTEALPAEKVAEAYRSECAERQVQQKQAERRESLEVLLVSRLASESSNERIESDRNRAEASLRELAASLDIPAAGTDEQIEALQSLRKRLQAEVSAFQAKRESWAELQALLAGRSLGELEAECDRARREVESCQRQVRESNVQVDEVSGDVSTLRAVHMEAQRRHDHLAGQLAECERKLVDVGCAREELVQATAEVERLELLGEVLDKTREFLESARDRVQRDMAPRLALAVTRRLPRITSGRYAEVLVNPSSLSLQVRPEGGDWRPATGLSHGTTEQVYLLLRIAMAEQLVTTGEPAPLVLDDITVQSDAHRTRAILDLLLDVSEDRQILLFSQETDVLSWAESRLTGDRHRVIRLTPAAASSSSAAAAAESRIDGTRTNAPVRG